MKKSNLIVFTSLTIEILGIAFYWYELRPSSIIKHCMQFTYDVLKGDSPVGFEEYKDQYDFYYKRCLQENGLKE
jgi:hypothetical protein